MRIFRSTAFNLHKTIPISHSSCCCLFSLLRLEHLLIQMDLQSDAARLAQQHAASAPIILVCGSLLYRLPFPALTDVSVCFACHRHSMQTSERTPHEREAPGAAQVMVGIAEARSSKIAVTGRKLSVVRSHQTNLQSRCSPCQRWSPFSPMLPRSLPSFNRLGHFVAIAGALGSCS